MEQIQDAHILLVEDNPALLQFVMDALHSAGWQDLSAAKNCAEASAMFAARKPDLMVLDINLPDGDGFALFQQFQTAADIPALFLSARDADEDRLFGLGLGADDYLTKPFLTQELLLRIRQILRRCYRGQLQKAEIVHLGKCCIDFQESAVVLNGRASRMTATERALLQKLAENRGRIVTLDALCRAVWQDDSSYGYENTLGVHIRHLREKIEEDPSHPRYLLTIRGLGYKLAGESKE